MFNDNINAIRTSIDFVEKSTARGCIIMEKSDTKKGLEKNKAVKKPIPVDVQKRMLEFFMQTSMPRKRVRLEKLQNQFPEIFPRIEKTENLEKGRCNN